MKKFFFLSVLGLFFGFFIVSCTISTTRYQFFKPIGEVQTVSTQTHSSLILLNKSFTKFPIVGGKEDGNNERRYMMFSSWDFFDKAFSSDELIDVVVSKYIILSKDDIQKLQTHLIEARKELSNGINNRVGNFSTFTVDSDVPKTPIEIANGVKDLVLRFSHFKDDYFLNITIHYYNQMDLSYNLDKDDIDGLISDLNIALDFLK